MTPTVVRCGALISVLILAIGCGAPAPASPTARSEPAANPGPSPPALSGPATTFVFAPALSPRVSSYTERSTFVLYDDGAFALQYAICSCPGQYPGRYTTTNGVVTFEWDGWSIAGPWGATGTLQGDTLTVHYNQIMQLTDFEDAVYLRMPRP